MTNASLNETLNMWYADKEYGACLIQSFGDMRNHRYHGLFGVIIIEPANARWYKNFSLYKTIYDEAAVITAPGIESFRECVVVTQNGIRMLDKNNQLVKTTAGEDGEDVDPEDTGEKGYNYRSERFANRLKKDSRISKIFNSRIHGNPLSKPIALQGGISIGNTFNMELSNGAAAPGDYLYRSGSFKWDVESGMWGILRVLRQGIFCKCKNLYHTCQCALSKKQS